MCDELESKTKIREFANSVDPHKSTDNEAGHVDIRICFLVVYYDRLKNVSLSSSRDGRKPELPKKRPGPEVIKLFSCST